MVSDETAPGNLYLASEDAVRALDPELVRGELHDGSLPFTGSPKISTCSRINFLSSAEVDRSFALAIAMKASPRSRSTTAASMRGWSILSLMPQPSERARRRHAAHGTTRHGKRARVLELLEVAERLPARRARWPQRSAYRELTRSEGVRDLVDGHVLHTIPADGYAPRLIRCD